ncbi:glycosyltransferase family 2 protein [Streptomyces collinus]|uniref:Transferase n=1 Tax=Streptomyces collinus (strain DSM 40733 / Tue 365) TaxID=1214242 RepID=S5ULK6_STRC3|nr:glycosyltransferase [Streptomyces collinus]AGS67798.1 transferase [Streptomyces collinus Tu 365]UJA06428.1 glycosyltransferase [Streptomyces collinus]UJA12402.1 glycosyltransferase [Streptomyces collinus]UJA12735.1 glycosyltransferase [Streptomyces collinus]UJA18703.1 glycosyltransferase [Streptomyces collinus]
MSTDRAPRTARAPTTGPDPRITVAVITRDRCASLLRTLDALAALPERPPVIVVDNSSSDTTRRAVRHHPAVTRLLCPGTNTGAVGRNLAVRHARTPYVAFSDDDSWWTPGSLRRAADLLDRHPRLGLLAARTLVGEEAADDPLNAVLAASPLPREPDLPGRPVLGFLACASVVRREAFLSAGGYHPLLFFGGEETLLAYDLAARGWGLAYEPALSARHQPGTQGRTGRSGLVRRNHVLTACLRRPWPVVLRAAADLALAAATGRPGARRALRETLERLPAALARRRPLPPHVEHAARLLDRRAAPGATR